MAIASVVINVADIARSVDFYTRFLDVRVVEETGRGALLDAVTATIRLHRVESPADSTWIADDLQAGFRHVGFKVSDLKRRVAMLQDAGVPFQLEPIHAEGDVWITFFYDPDGTLLELVEGPLQYHEVFDQSAVDADWGLGDPERPRFDHVAETVADAHSAHAYFGELGFTLMGGIHQPSDSRGFEITYLRSGDSSLEIFEFGNAEVSLREPQTTAPGFASVEFEGRRPAAATELEVEGERGLLVDPDLLVHSVTER
ncbi:VOC family protein [Microbacterium kunmingense]|uniref:VOC family protein n=1 Tax=Microbacterium kunmingense TaxID=2915939 RepID=UPI0020057B31|nr:VOC family protein [Microbacterium kunmingense]